MANALALNSENTTDVILTTLTQTTQTQDKTAGSDVSGNVNFNNVLNNLNSKTKSAQSNLEKTVLKSNTSSINKEALNQKTTTHKPVKTEKQVTENKIQAQNSETTATQTVSSEKDIQLNKNKKVEAKNETVSTTNAVQAETKVGEQAEIKENNNSSFPSPSPVFSSQEAQTTTEEITKEDVIAQIEELLGSITLTQDIELDLNTDLTSEIEDKLSQITSVEEITTTIEEITSFLNNSDLNNTDKETLLNELKKVQDLLANNEIKNIDFENILSEVKTKLTDVIKDTLFDITKQIKVQDLSLENEKLTLNLEKIDTLLNKEEDSTLNEVKTIVKDLKDKIEKTEIQITDEQIINQETSEIQNLNKEIENFVSKIQNKETIDTTEVESIKDSLSKILDKISISENKELQTNDIEVSLDAELDTTQKTETQINELFSKNIEQLEKIFEDQKLDEKEVKDLSKILEVFENALEEDKTIDEETEIEIKNLVSKLQENLDAINTPEIQEQNISIVSQLKDLIKTETTEKYNKENEIIVSDVSNDDIKISESVEFEIPKEINFEQKDLNQNTNLNAENKTIEIEKPEENIEINIEDTTSDFEIKLDETTITTQETENLNKTSFIDNTLKDMLIEIDYEMPSVQASTLTVADEIVKMAMDEPTSLNIDTSLKGNVIYDPASGNSSVIKNVNLAKTIQTPQNFGLEQHNVLNQVTDKIQQMKDNQGQKLTMVLRPNDLGRLSIELSTNHLGLTTNILAQNEDVRAYIERNIDALKQQLSEAGVNVNSIQIKTAGQEGTSTYEGNQNLAQQQEQQQNAQNQNQKQNNEQQKAKEEYITSLGGYEFQEAKDFSNILNKTMNYSLN